MQFWGYERPDGTVGVRNYLAIVGAGNTAHHMAVQIAREVKGAVPLLLDEALLRLKEDRDRARRTVVGLGHNPNLAAVLLVGFGGGHMDPIDLAQEIAGTKKPIEVATVLDSKGFSPAIEKGLSAARHLMGKISRMQRQPSLDRTSYVGRKVRWIGGKFGAPRQRSGRSGRRHAACKRRVNNLFGNSRSDRG